MTIRDENGFTLVDVDHASGRSVWSYFDGEKTVYRVDYPVGQTIQANAEKMSSATTNWSGEWHHVASVPLNVAWDSGLVDASSQRDDKWMSRFLNDSDNRAWRTKPGAL